MDLKKLLTVAKENKSGTSVKVAKLIASRTSDPELLSIAAHIMDSILVNIDEMKSLVSPEKYEFDPQDVEKIEVKL